MRQFAHNTLAFLITVALLDGQVLAADVGIETPGYAPEKDPGRQLETPGRWRLFQGGTDDQNLTAEQRQQIEQLEAIGYLSGSTTGSVGTGVVKNRADLTWPGLNLYNSGHEPEAVLMDMEGRTIHRWARPFSDVFPELRPSPLRVGVQHWRRVFLYPNGDLLAIYEGLGIARLDKNSQVIWTNPCGAHHDLEVLPNGQIYVLTRRAHMVPRVNTESPILEDYITLLDKDGKEIESISLLECFENSTFKGIWPGRRRNWGDIFHTNSIEVLDGRIADCVPAFRTGNILTSMLGLDAIAVVDLAQKRVVWARRGVFLCQHDPQILSNGNLLLFDNRGIRGQSRIIEYEPDRMSVAWQYGGTPESQFYSHSCGTCQRLPNGNTLITESDNGRAFEITYEGEIVWEFVNPNRAGDSGEFIATLFEVKRLPADFPVAWASALADGEAESFTQPAPATQVSPGLPATQP